MIDVRWVDPDDMIVEMLVALADWSKGSSAVLAHHVPDVDRVDAVDVDWIGKQLRVIQADRVEAGHLFPGRSSIPGSKRSAAVVRRFYYGVDYVGIDRRHRESDAPELRVIRQTGLRAVPGRATVGRAPEPRLR